MSLRPRVNKLIETLRTETPEMLEALDALASIQKESSNINTTSSMGKKRNDFKKNLRSDLEFRSQTIVENFLAQAEIISARIEEVQGIIVNDLQKECDKLLLDLNSCEEATQKFVGESTHLREERAKLEEKAEALSQFLSRFQLSDSHVQVLTNGLRQNTEEFFEALAQVRRIRDECTNELISGSLQGIGLQIFDTMVLHQENAYQQIYAWIQEESGASFGRELEVESNRILYSNAFRELRLGSPAFFKHCAELLSNARKGEVSKKFNAIANQAFQTNGVDALRTMQDLLTGLHQVLAEEQDVIYGVLLSEMEVEEEKTTPPHHADAGVTSLTKRKIQNEEEVEANEENNKNIANAALMNAIGVLDPLLESRIQKLLHTYALDGVTLFRLAQMFEFYGENMIQKLLVNKNGNSHVSSPASGVTSVLRSAAASTMLLFFQIMVKKGNELVNGVKNKYLAITSLSATIEVLEMVRSLKEILNSIKDDWNKSKETHQNILNAFVLPIRTMTQQADSLFASNKFDGGVFVINNLQALLAVLTMFDFTADTVQELTMDISEHIDAISAIRMENALKKAGLLPYLKLLDNASLFHQSNNNNGGSSLDPVTVKSCFELFYKDLSSSLVMPEFDKIDAPRLRQQARTLSCSLIKKEHHRLFDAFKVEWKEKFLVLHTKEQVDELLNV